MSETRGTYNVGGGATLRPETLVRVDDPRYDPPTHEDVRALQSLSRLTGGELARLAGIDSGSRGFRRWSAPPGGKNSTTIPYGAWRLLLIETGLLPAEEAGPHPALADLQANSRSAGRPPKQAASQD